MALSVSSEDQRQTWRLRLTWRLRSSARQIACAPLLLLALAACGGEQVQPPESAPHLEATPLSLGAAPAAVTPAAPRPAPLVRVAPPTAPYGKLWEEALRHRPWPKISAKIGPAEESAAPETSGRPANAAYGNPLNGTLDPNDPDPYHVVPQELDMQVLLPYLQGVSSWYGPTFHGKPTANGEIYNQYALTAAHPVLPIGTKIQVENLENGRKVWVRINDRGPYAKGRILDLSKIAAQQLGMIQNGTAQVRITVLQWPDTINPILGLKAYTQHVVQAAAYPDLEEAEHLRERLQARFPQVPVMIDIASNGFFSVVAGPFDDETEARNLSRQMQRAGITNLVRRYRN